MSPSPSGGTPSCDEAEWTPLPPPEGCIREPFALTRRSVQLPGAPFGAAFVVARVFDRNGDGAIDAGDGSELVVGSDAGLSLVDPVELTLDRHVDGWFRGVLAVDVDGDGSANVVAIRQLTAVDHSIEAYDADGALLWATPGGDIGFHPTGADLDGDGSLEIVYSTGWRVHVLRAATGERLWESSVAVGVPSTVVAIADLDLDGRAEILAGTRVFSADGSLLWEAPLEQQGTGWMYPVQADADPESEVAQLAYELVRVFEPGGELSVERPSGAHDPGPGCVADLDGDGRQELAAPFSNEFRVFDLGSGDSTGFGAIDGVYRNGCALFDFDGDGAREVVAMTDDELRIWSADGAPRSAEPHPFQAYIQMVPQIVDVDGDGHAEIVTVGGTASEMEVVVFSHADGAWPGAGAVWASTDFTEGRFTEAGGARLPAVDAGYRSRDAHLGGWDLWLSGTAGCGCDSAPALWVEVTNRGGEDAPEVELSAGTADGQTLRVAVPPIPGGGSARVEVPLGTVGAALAPVELRLDPPGDACTVGAVVEAPAACP